MDKKELSCRLPRIRKRYTRCYELAFRGWLQSHGQGDSWELVHGWWGELGCGHAWLEKGEMVYCPVLDAVFTKDEYRSSHRAIEFRRFVDNEAAKISSAAGHYGPWNPELAISSFEYFEQVPDCGDITTAPPTTKGNY